METPSKLAYGIKDLSEALGIAPSTVRTLIDTGKLRAVRVGKPGGRGKFLISGEAVQKFLRGELA